ncbi:hypothetical protein GCM10025789_10070 [Tessaracoccus lubricantis]|uniref:Type VII secretion system protein EssD-like domain-containing protein n=1 Tax=Tessaracoccus lubricantis TaxID=545543 RepID=A0ABP9F5E9_9ACTN
MAKVPSEAAKGIMAKAMRKLKWVDEPFERVGNVHKLKKDAIYESGKKGTNVRYVYTTDAQGRISSAHARPLELPPKTPRANHNSKTPDKLPGDHAGHLFADMFGGSGRLDNLVSQASDVNLGKMGALERDWRKRLEAGEKFDVDIDVRYGDNARPTQFIVRETLADGTVVRHRFRNE